MECVPNRLTPLYSKIYYEEENYLKVRTAVFKYITPPHSKGLVCGALVRQYIGTLMFWVYCVLIFLRSELLYVLSFVI